MQSSSRAPELSATFSRDSCWIISLYLAGFLDDVDQAPALGLRQGAGLDDADDVALAGLVALVVRVQPARAADDLLVGPVPAGDFDPHRDRLVALVGDDDALAHLRRVGVALGPRGARPGRLRRFGGGAFLAAFVGLALAALLADVGALLWALLGAGLVRLA